LEVVTVARLNAGTIIAAMVAILLSLAGAFLARQLLISETPPVVPPEEPKVTIPVATMDLPAGRELKRGDIGTLVVTKEEMIKLNLPRVYIANAADIAGRILRVPLKAQQAFSPDDLYPQGTGPSLAEELTPGLRAVTIGVTDSGFVNGFANPGSIVDVLFRLGASGQPGGNTTPRTFNILENIRVLAVERTAFPGSQQEPQQLGLTKVTLAVTPDQAGQLKVLEGNGDLILTLRSPNDLSKEQLERRLSETAQRLESLLAESQTFHQIRNAALQVGTDFDDADRVAELEQAIASEQQQVADLRQSLQRAASPSRVQSLEEILQLRTNIPSIVERLQPGMRAVTIAIKGSGFVDGFAVPGTRVDVLFRLSGLDGRRDFRETTFTLLESVEVLAAAQSTESRPFSASGVADGTIPVTLAVTAAQASKLKVVEGRGELSLVLRPMDEPADRRPAVAHGEGEAPPEAIQQELAAAQAELDDLLAEQVALQQLERLAQRRQIQFTGNERLAALETLVAEAQERIEALMAAAEKPPQVETPPKTQLTLNDVLGIADPPLQPEPVAPQRDTMEIYRGGARSMMVFDRGGGAVPSTVGFSANDVSGAAAGGVSGAASGNAAGGAGDPGGTSSSSDPGCTNCGDKSVIQRPL
jgi:Flp pilus assembly protein CpaB